MGKEDGVLRTPPRGIDAPVVRLRYSVNRLCGSATGHRRGSM